MSDWLITEHAIVKKSEVKSVTVKRMNNPEVCYFNRDPPPDKYSIITNDNVPLYVDLLFEDISGEMKKIAEQLCNNSQP